MNPLAPVLYERLRDRFASVLIANEGEAIYAPRLTDARTGRPRVQVISPGEQYRVNCRKCGDTRHRLYVGHRWAEYEWMVHCHNEDCYASPAARHQLYVFVLRTRRPVAVPVVSGRRVARSAAAPRLPGVMTQLSELPAGHPAVVYLAERGFDPAELARLYRVGYCGQADPSFRMADRRIVAPVETAGRLVGWQARFVGDRNWKACPAPKYYTMPGMARHLTLYNLDQARTQAFGVLVEGMTDVWAVGPHAVGLFGKSISFAQNAMLVRTFRDRPLAVMLDGDAHKENEAITAGLAREMPASVVRVVLPSDRDPADFNRAALAELVRHEADRQGVRLPRLT